MKNKKPNSIEINMLPIIYTIGILLFLVGGNWFLIVKNTPVYTYLIIYGILLIAIGFIISLNKSPDQNLQRRIRR